MYNDYELLYLAQENNEDAVNELRKKYNSLLYAKALSYSRSSHIDIKELLNETELAFYKAIDNYIDKNTFNTYLNKVIDNNLTNYIAKHNVTKNKILNESISYENNNERILELESNKYNPEVNLFNDYDYSSLRNKNMKKYIIGIDIGGTKCAVLLGRAQGHADDIIIDKLRFETRVGRGWRAVTEELLDNVEEIIKKNALSPEDILCAGISCGGPLDSRRGVILAPPNLPDWECVPIVDMIEERFWFDAYLQNDANA